jgi:ABC-type multidrug transport system ATPase subunit
LDTAPDIRLRGLVKRYGDLAAVDGVDLDVARGEFFTLLGPSGSGKTTTLRMIAGFERPDAGTIELAGTDVLPIWILANHSRPNQLPIVNVVGVLVILLPAIPVYLAHRLTADSEGDSAAATPMAAA